MAFNQFTNLDFQDLRTQIKDYLRSNSNFTDFDFEGSNFSVLIDNLAYNSYITAYNTNMAVNEAFIDSATVRENVVSLARNIGYVPRSKRSAVAKISFTVDTSNIAARYVTLNAGIVALGNIQNGSFKFSIPEKITVSPASNGIASFQNIEIFEGNYLTKEFQVVSSQLDAKYILPNTNIDTTSIRVSVTDGDTGTIEVYNAYENIFQVNSESRLFLIQEVNDEKYQILFGDGVLGKKPPNGSTIKVSYIVTNGTDGNGASNFNFAGNLSYPRRVGDTISDTAVTSNISLLTVPQASENGDNIEPIDNVKYLAPRVYASQYRAVTANDYIGLVPSVYPNIDSVSAYGGEELDPPQYGKVFITVKPKTGEVLSSTAKTAIAAGLKQYTVAGIQQEFLDLKFLYVEYDSTVSYNPGFVTTKEDLSSRIFKSIETYSKSPDINSFGGRLKYSKLLSVIDKVDTAITSNITVLKMRRDMVPAYGQLANYELCYANKFHADLEGFNIRSTSFKIAGVDGDVFLTDLPNSDGLTGVVRFFTLVDDVPNFINNNAGTVDYVKGEIILFAVNISSSSVTNKIEIEVIPESNDIIAKQNLYIVLDTTSGSKLTLLEDLVSSGSDRSGSSYAPPSSFVNTKRFTR